jgi:hypothetical protein
MGKIIALTESMEIIFEPEYGLMDDFFFEAQSKWAIERAAELTPIGYDNEIGLWEEMESRSKRKEIMVHHLVRD